MVVVLNSVLQLKNLIKCSTGENRDAWTLWEVIYWMKTVNLGETLENMGSNMELCTFSERKSHAPVKKVRIGTVTSCTGHYNS